MGTPGLSVAIFVCRWSGTGVSRLETFFSAEFELINPGEETYGFLLQIRCGLFYRIGCRREFAGVRLVFLEIRVDFPAYLGGGGDGAHRFLVTHGRKVTFFG
ncbi:MAG: hypothetical protein ACLFNQ_02015 [Spirochaetaceae bacterium]